MNRVLLALALAGLFAGASLSAGASLAAAPPSAAQKDEFYKVCMSIADNQTLCSCKAEAALKLIDTDFMAIVIDSMKGKTLPVQYSVPYDTYVAKSNHVCIPGY